MMIKEVATRNKKSLALGAALVAQIIFGFSFMFTKIAMQTATPLVVIANRYMVAFVCLSLWLLVKRIHLNFKKNIVPLVLMSIFQPCLYFVFESYGVQLTTSSFSAVMIALIPIASMICGMFALKEIPSPFQFVFTILSVVGIIVLALQGKSDGTVTLDGVLLLAGAVISSVGYNILSRRLSTDFNAEERTFAMTLIGLVFFSFVAWVNNCNNPTVLISGFGDIKYVFSILYLSVFSSVIAFLFLNFAHKRSVTN